MNLVNNTFIFYIHHMKEASKAIRAIIIQTIFNLTPPELQNIKTKCCSLPSHQLTSHFPISFHFLWINKLYFPIKKKVFKLIGQKPLFLEEKYHFEKWWIVGKTLARFEKTSLVDVKVIAVDIAWDVAPLRLLDG